MKKSMKFCGVLLAMGLFLMTGCSFQQNADKTPTNAKEDANIYDSLIAANEKYGSDKEQICKSNFKCDPSEISENVIIAPTW